MPIDPTFSAWWNFASGAIDATGNGNDGALHGTTLTTDPFGRSARRFNGSSDYIDGTSSPLGVPDVALVPFFVNPNTFFVVGDTSSTNSWRTAVITAGGTVSGNRQILLTNLVLGLQADGVWSKLDRLLLPAAENTPSGLIDLVHNVAATAVSSPTFTVDRGFNGDGAVAYINTNFNPAVDGVNYTLNSACAGVWAPAPANPAGDDRVILGAYDSFLWSIDITVHYSGDGNTYCRINSDAGAQIGVPYPGPGLFMVNRSGASSAELYWNGASIATSAGPAWTYVPSLAVGLFARNINGAFGSNSADRASAVVFGGSLTATENLKLYNRLRTYMTAIGAP